MGRGNKHIVLQSTRQARVAITSCFQVATGKDKKVVPNKFI